MRQEERRAETTARLLDAAAQVFAERGFHAATVDEIAAAAGRTKGAVYANFAGKDALFLALLDRHLDDQFAQLDRLVSATSPDDLRDWLRTSAVEQTTGGGGPFGLLMLEFWLYGARVPAAREALAERYRLMRAGLATALAERTGDKKKGRPTADELATAVLALDAGLVLYRILEPDSVPPRLRADLLSALITSPS